MEKACLTFLPNVSLLKPNDVLGQSACPFCQLTALEKILLEEGDALWVENKYRTLEETYQTVLIESKAHDFNLAYCSLEKLKDLLEFIFVCWEKLAADSRFSSTLFLKNYGPWSGASLRHSHSQLVALKKWDVAKQADPIHFAGLDLYHGEGVSATLSTQPIMGYTELNIYFEPKGSVEELAELLQALVIFILNQQADRKEGSYNLFGWRYLDHYQFKLVPRYIDSAYFVGFGIAQVFPMDKLEKMAEDIRSHYLKELLNRQ